MKKRILFVVTYMDTGGISRSLQNILNRYDKSKFDVDLFAMVHQGAFKGKFENCIVLPRDTFVEASVAHYENQHGLAKFESIVLKLADKLTHYKVQKWLFKKAGKKLLRQCHYDAVIGFSEGLPTVFVSAMSHPNKIAWIHCDYSSYMKVGSDVPGQRVYERIHKIVCVSEYTRSTFTNIYPSLAERTRTVYNIVDSEMMRAMKMESIKDAFDEGYFNIVSVGRIDPVKRLSAIPELARKITDAGCQIHWYVIGPKGSDDELQRFYDNIKKYDTERIVLPLGEKTNPYPYIAKADLLVNTSISEACPYVVNEAKILGTPVVCTDFGSAKEFIDYGKNGYYEPIEKMAERIIWLINNPSDLFSLKQNLMSFRYDNQEILNQISKLIN